MDVSAIWGINGVSKLQDILSGIMQRDHDNTP
ncbi:Uncharacterised protein [Shewanella putrefaciens]|nr:Uncharacterised protein [Shewanella putrefaciens]